MNTEPVLSAVVMTAVSMVLIVVGLVVWFASLAALVVTHRQAWRYGITVGGLSVFVGCCLWHTTRQRGGAS